MTQARKTNVRILVESALCIALAVVLSELTPFKMPLGGSVTPFATVPIIVIGLRHGTKWGVATALVYSFTQTLLGLSNLAWIPVQTFGFYLLCILLDYVLAYTCLGFTGTIARIFKNRNVGLTVGVIATGFARFTCSFFSGILIWGVPEEEAANWTAAGWSFVYNGTWCLPDVAIALAALLILVQVPALGLLPAKKPAGAEI
ncbi:MAG: energy-coupled thiamine transporter ThiT [Oscillospiraceae bacterium]|jgi:thiamine transporter|nr:energy-coupled thiamine transporter ThiT [Oscillospiraceae bacterium]